MPPSTEAVFSIPITRELFPAEMVSFADPVPVALMDESAVELSTQLFSAVEPTEFWWNTSLAMDLVQQVHTVCGLPYWAAIVAITAGVRSFMFPLTVLQFRNTAKLANANPDIQRVMDRAKEKQKLGTASAEDNILMQKELASVYKKHDVNPMKGLAMPLAQAPIFMTFFFALRGMAERYPEIMEGGALWFRDLSAPDPYFVLPILSSLSMLATFELTSADNPDKSKANTMKPFMRGFCVIIAPISAYFPTSLLTYWVTSNTMSFLQTSLLRVPAVKRFFSIPDRVAVAEGNERSKMSTIAAKPGAPRPKVTFNSPPTPMVKRAVKATTQESEIGCNQATKSNERGRLR